MSGDPYDLERFMTAQAGMFDGAIDELRAGRKRRHWMWFVFPQLKGLGRSTAAQIYGVGSLGEAIAYIEHPVLGSRLEAAVAATQASPAAYLLALFGTPDNMKFRSSMTLFAVASPKGPYQAALDRWCDGQTDVHTVALLRQVSANEDR